MKLLVYMPALNEGETVYSVLKSVPTNMEGFTEVELLVIDDGSVDNTKEEAIKAGATVISHSNNRGVGVAFQSALNYALKINADVLVSIDADGQFDVSQISAMVLPIIENKADFSIGNRFWNTKPKKMSKIKFWGNIQVSRIVSFVSKTKIYDASCGFRAYSKDCILNLNLQGDFTYTHETILDLINKGHSVAQVQVDVKYFEGRVSRVAGSIPKYAYRTSVIIFKCLKDYKPFQFFMSIALFVLVLASLLGGFVLLHWLKSGQITPYKSLGFISLFLVGITVVIVILAFIADMLNRIRQNQEKILYLTKKNYFEQD